MTIESLDSAEHPATKGSQRGHQPAARPTHEKAEHLFELYTTFGERSPIGLVDVHLDRPRGTSQLELGALEDLRPDLHVARECGRRRRKPELLSPPLVLLDEADREGVDRFEGDLLTHPVDREDGSARKPRGGLGGSRDCRRGDRFRPKLDRGRDDVFFANHSTVFVALFELPRPTGKGDRQVNNLYTYSETSEDRSCE